MQSSTFFAPDFVDTLTCGTLTSSSNPITQIEVVQSGLTKAGVCALADALCWKYSEMASVLGLGQCTLTRNKDVPLNKFVSESVFQLANLSNVGVVYFGNVNNWRNWLKTNNPQFGNAKPLSVLGTIRGRELIQRVINQLQYGFSL